MATLTAEATLNTTFNFSTGHHLATAKSTTVHTTEYRKPVAINRVTVSADSSILAQQPAVIYNGSSSEFQITSNFQSNFADDGTIISLVTWIKPSATIGGTTQGIFGLFQGTSDQKGIQLRIDSAGSFNGTLVFGNVRQIYGGRAYSHRLYSTFFSAGITNWTCIMICLEVGGGSSSVKHMWYNNNNASPTLNPSSSSGFTTSGTLYPVIGNNNGGGDFFNGAIGPIWMTDEEIDFSVAANRQKFTDVGSTGGIADLGADGATPTGTQPKIFIKGTATTITQHGSLSIGSGTITRGNLTNSFRGVHNV